MALHSQNNQPNYRLNCGQYVLYKGDAPVQAPMDEVALAFDSEAGVLHKHGKPDQVSAWAASARKSLGDAAEAAGDEEARRAIRALASALVVIQGRFPLEELNRCLSTSGYVGVLYRKALQNQLPCLDILGRVQQPLLAR